MSKKFVFFKTALLNAGLPSNVEASHFMLLVSFACVYIFIYV